MQAKSGSHLQNLCVLCLFAPLRQGGVTHLPVLPQRGKEAEGAEIILEGGFCHIPIRLDYALSIPKPTTISKCHPLSLPRNTCIFKHGV